MSPGRWKRRYLVIELLPSCTAEINIEPILRSYVHTYIT
jgi:hypothetical protein